MCDEETQRVERTDVGVSISVELTRGTDTRDQDKIKGKVKAPSLKGAREDMDEVKEDLRELADVCRVIQPDGEE
ncbi:hypothetical protein [Saliphagus sp. LR7]|uniref:DUF7389 domain-containing protein n=1 Tax=Saliphagus sp. LR7 TaxID=2282654 RepID=UPI000DF84D39|nr:hypothetical protein [Saliphagus sp. LR7]